MGSGRYHEVEIKAYHPQWFQHEFMHHLYREWPEFDLELTSHQWFDRKTWPSDFQGEWEHDYYAESIDKRFLSATPSLADGLKGGRWQPIHSGWIEDTSKLVGKYRRNPMENGWHKVEVIKHGSALRWTNAAGFSWSLEIRDGKLWAGDDCIYGAQEIPVSSDRVTALYFREEKYVRV